MLYSDTLQRIIISYTDIILLLSQKCHKIPHFMQNRLYKTDYTKRINACSSETNHSKPLLCHYLYSILLPGS